MASIPLPALSVNSQQPSPLDTYAKVLGIRSAQQEQQLRDSQLQTEQLQQTGLGQENQQRALAIKSQQAIAKTFMDFDPKNGDIGDFTSGFAKKAMANGALPSDAFGQQKAFIDAQDSLNKMNSSQIDLASKRSTMVTDALDAALDPKVADADLPATLNSQLDNLQSAGAFDPQHIQAGRQIAQLAQTDPASARLQLQKIEQANGLQSKMLENAKSASGATSAAQSADPVLKLSTPEALAAPGAQAAIQTLINDPKTNPSDIPRLQALLPKATVAQNQVVTQKQREDQASQTVSQGDPDAAGKLLASRALTIDELKLRNATPQFMEKAVLAAQKYDPSFKAAEASAQANIAKAPANQQFFGNTDSLLTAGGTLDQLSKAATALPQGQIPVFNKVENLVKTATGQGPQAAYAASILGVADDYAKVMGGAVGTDTARQQIMQRLDAAQSPEQKQAVINQFRQQIASQRAGRIGTNPYLKDMYPEPGQSGRQANGAGAVPQGATHKVPGADGKLHYTNAQGTVDLGVVPGQ